LAGNFPKNKKKKKKERKKAVSEIQGFFSDFLIFLSYPEIPGFLSLKSLL
jgi:hypothetical protein